MLGIKIINEQQLSEEQFKVLFWTQFGATILYVL